MHSWHLSQTRKVWESLSLFSFFLTLFSGQKRKGTGWCRKEEKNQPIWGCKYYSKEGVREKNISGTFLCSHQSFHFLYPDWAYVGISKLKLILQKLCFVVFIEEIFYWCLWKKSTLQMRYCSCSVFYFYCNLLWFGECTNNKVSFSKIT